MVVVVMIVMVVVVMIVVVVVVAIVLVMVVMIVISRHRWQACDQWTPARNPPACGVWEGERTLAGVVGVGGSGGG